MGWEVRPGGRYYYQKVWRNGTCHSEYVGRGAMAELMANVDERMRLHTADQRGEWGKLIQAEEAIQRGLEQYRGSVMNFVRMGLEAVGYHQHKGQWRLKRVKTKTEVIKEGQGVISGEVVAALTAKKPTLAQLKELHEAMIEHPQLLDVLCNLPQMVQGMIMNNMTDKPAVLELMRARTKRMREELGYGDSTVLEHSLIDQIVTTWLHVQRIEMQYEVFWKSNGTFKEGDYWERKLSAAHRRHQKAVESLARVRHLLSRAEVQINIAQQQIVRNG